MKNKLKITTLLGKIRFRLTENIDQKIICKFRNKKIKNKDFTIISNNCFAGWVYRTYNLPYNTPTVGLFIMPECYLKFVISLKYYIDKNIEFIKPNESKYKEYLEKNVSKFGHYPIGKLEDIEIHFLHYKTEEEAKEKWERRKKRINYNKIIFKFNDQNGCTKEDIITFMNTNKNNIKICFVANKAYNIEGTYFIKQFDLNNFVIDDTWFCRKYINLSKIINNL